MMKGIVCQPALFPFQSHPYHILHPPSTPSLFLFECPRKAIVWGMKRSTVSASLSEMQIVNKSDCMLVYEGLPARRYNVLPRLPYITQLDRRKRGEIPFHLELFVIESANSHPYISKATMPFHSAWKCELNPLKRLVGFIRPTQRRLKRLVNLHSY